MLLNMRDEGIVVSRNATMFSSAGIPHEIDIYYEFKKAGVTHRVAIECKNTQRAIEKGRVQEFESKIRDLPGVVGVIVSAGGYQQHARDFAESKGIMPLRLQDLPAIPQLLAERIKTVALPDESYYGEPFWTIMEIREGKVTGSYFASHHPGANAPLIPMVFSKSHAEDVMREAGLSRDKWGVRGLPRYALRAFILMLQLIEMQGKGAMIGFRPPHAGKGTPLIWIPVTRQQLIEEYYYEDIPLVKANER